MWKTLGFLVVAMSGTSVMLGWMDPMQMTETRAATEAEIISLVQEAVRSDTSVGIDARKWRDVEIGRHHSRSMRGSLLAATASTVDYHFYVDHLGRPMRTANWRNQTTIEESPGTIRIEVATPKDENPVSAAQRFCIEKLMKTLADTLGSGDRLTAYWPERWRSTDEEG